MIKHFKISEEKLGARVVSLVAVLDRVRARALKSSTEVKREEEGRGYIIL